jgi:hypothetical protein
MAILSMLGRDAELSRRAIVDEHSYTSQAAPSVQEPARQDSGPQADGRQMGFTTPADEVPI